MEANYSALDNMVLPHSMDAEQAVLGAILKDPDCLHIVADMLKLEHLFVPQHKAIYSAIISIDTMGNRIDPLVVLEQLKKDGTFDDIGGKAYLMKLAEAVPSTVFRRSTPSLFPIWRLELTFMLKNDEALFLTAMSLTMSC